MNSLADLLGTLERVQRNKRMGLLSRNDVATFVEWVEGVRRHAWATFGNCLKVEAHFAAHATLASYGDMYGSLPNYPETHYVGPHTVITFKNGHFEIKRKELAHDFWGGDQRPSGFGLTVRIGNLGASLDSISSFLRSYATLKNIHVNGEAFFVPIDISRLTRRSTRRPRAARSGSLGPRGPRRR